MTFSTEAPSRAEAVYAFDASSPDELSFQAGDIITSVQKVDDEWLMGEHAGSTGIFPSSFVVFMDDAVDSSAPKEIAKESVGNQPHCEALFDYGGEGQGDLPFKTGDVITLIERVDEEWMMGSVGGKEGMFPVAFVKVLKDLPSPGKHFPILQHHVSFGVFFS